MLSIARTGTLTLMMLFTVSAHASDWAAWRGPVGNGLSSESGWYTPNAEIAWTVDVGVGYTPVSVVDDRVYCAGWADGKDTIYCLNARDGKEIWSHSYRAQRYGRQHEGGPAAQVVVADSKAYLLDRAGVLRCVSADRGKPQWEINLARQLGVKAPTWMFSGSPVVRDNMMYVEMGVICAIDLRSKKIVWRTRDFGPSYSTPQPFQHGGRDLIAAFPKSGLVIVDAKRGSVVAQHAWETKYDVNSATPLVVDDKIFITSGYGKGCALLQLRGSKLKLLWQNRNIRSQMASCVAINGYIYGFDDRVLTCLSMADGSTQWKHRKTGKGALIASDGKLIIQADRGDLVIANATPNEYQQLLRTNAVGGRHQWTMPTLSHGVVYCRSATGKVACIRFK